MNTQLLADRYKIINVLGAGGMGQTYVAEDTQRPNNPKCVVKQLKPVSPDPNFLVTARRLFTGEAEMLDKVGNHDQIPRLFAYFERDGEFYLVQEWIDGRPLSAELPLGQRWTEPQVIALLKDVLVILEFIHGQGVIHRDIKPDNIMRRRQDGKLVLIDFGAVKQVRTQQTTAVGQISMTVAIGTPGYMPTEQSSGKPRPSSDIYALGMVAIQALTGLLPSQLREDEDGEVIWRDQAEISADLANVLMTMTRHYFKNRYQTASDVLKALKELESPSFNNAYTPTQVVEERVYTPTNVVTPLPTRPIHAPTVVSETNSTRNQQQPVSTQVNREKRSGNWQWVVGGVSVLGGLFIFTQLPKLSNPVSSTSPASSVSPAASPTASDIDNGQQTLNQAISESTSTGNLGRAIELAKGIPTNSNVYSQAQNEINKWQATWDQENAAFGRMNEAYNAGRWQDVVNIGKELPQKGYWDSKVNSMYYQAQNNLKSLEKPKPVAQSDSSSSIKKTPADEIRRLENDNARLWEIYRQKEARSDTYCRPINWSNTECKALPEDINVLTRQISANKKMLANLAGGP